MAKMMVLAGLLAVSVVSLSAEQARVSPEANARLGALRKAEQGNPYGRLFQAQQMLKQAVADKEAARPKVVCGMLIVPADPTLDPRMRVTPPQDPTVEYRIRTLDPPVCNPAK